MKRVFTLLSLVALLASFQPFSFSQNQALDFTGGGAADYVQFSNQFLFHQPGDATLEFWVMKHTTIDESILWTGFPGEDRNRYNILTCSGVCFDYREPNGNISGHIFGGTNSFANGTWVHIALVRSGNTYYKYLNGVLSGSAVDNNPNLPNWVGWRISGRLSYFHTRFTGSIDDLRLWNYARTAAEIQADMNNELSGCEAGLAGYWSFNEASGNIVFDESGNGNDGTMINNPVRTTNAPNLSPPNSDNDGDGYAACQNDCNDEDAAINPDATEICNGLDDDCDGSTDEGTSDADNDGICDELDPCPNDPLNDADNDGFCADLDNCPDIANPDQSDIDNEGIGDACDPCPSALPVLPNFNETTCNCDPGYYAVTTLAGEFVVITGCQICPPGTYCPDGVNSIPCPAGTYQGNPGAVECEPCAAGSFSSFTGSTACTLCPAGSFEDSPGSTECESCPPGSFSSTTGSTVCTACPAGSFEDSPGSTQCESCPPGSFSSTTGSTVCTACPAGSFEDSPGSTECESCPPGSFSSTTGSTVCTACPAGSFEDSPGSTECESCPPGSFSSTTGSTVCTACPAGSFEDSPGSTQCESCPPGSFSSTTGSTVCTSCPAGSFEDSPGSTECESCPPGSFSSTTGSVACSSCPANTYQSNAGSTFCENCPSGTSSDPGSTICEPCPAEICGNNLDDDCDGSVDEGCGGPPLTVNAGTCQVVYRGYAPQACTTLTAVATGGVAPYTFLWSNGATTASISVCPTTTTTYTVTATDASGATATDPVTVEVVDVRCGNNMNKVNICHNPNGNSNTLCVAQSAVAAHLAHGDYLGTCGTNPCSGNNALIAPPQPNEPESFHEEGQQADEEEIFDSFQPDDFQVFPNPASSYVNVWLKRFAGKPVDLVLYDRFGREVLRHHLPEVEEGLIRLDLRGEAIRDGLHFVGVIWQGRVQAKKLMVAKSW